jgi:dihydroflavonol-4-reductase
MRVAITGVSGFVGSAVARRLAESGHRITGLVRAGGRREHIVRVVDRFVEGDHADAGCWPGLLDSADRLVHCSVERRAWAPDQPDALNLHLRSNLTGSIHLLRASAPLPFIFMSSMAVHPDMPPPPDDSPAHLLPGSYYAAYKAAVEAHLTAESANGRRTATLRPCRVYGPDPVLERSRGHDLIRAIRLGEPVTCRGWGRYVHIEDVAAAAAAVVEKPGGAYDLIDCYAQDRDWAELAAEVLGMKAEIHTADRVTPRGELTGDAARSLGPGFDRGLEGIRRHLAELAAAMGS